MPQPLSTSHRIVPWVLICLFPIWVFALSSFTITSHDEAVLFLVNGLGFISVVCFFISLFIFAKQNNNNKINFWVMYPFLILILALSFAFLQRH